MVPIAYCRPDSEYLSSQHVLDNRPLLDYSILSSDREEHEA
jgi:hypothetical protein